MNKILFNSLLSVWQRLPVGRQNKLIDRFKNRKNFSGKTLEPKLPFSAVIDPTNVCNLDCPLCASRLQHYSKGYMTHETFDLILKKIPSLRIVVFFNWGEPFLNPRIFEFFRKAVDKNIYTITHSNFSLERDDSFFENIIKSGLHQLVLSIDGFTQKNYEQYRIKGNIELILSNMKRLVAVKKKLKSRDPKIVWKFIVNRFNENEIGMAKDFCKKHGIEFVTDRIGLGDDIPDFQFGPSVTERRNKWLPKNTDYILPVYKNEKSYKYPYIDAPCGQLFSSIVVNHDAKITPCCWVTNKDNTFGDLKEQSFEEIWHNEKYKHSRGLFLENPFEKKIETVCTSCEIFNRKHGHFKKQPEGFENNVSFNGNGQAKHEIKAVEPVNEQI